MTISTGGQASLQDLLITRQLPRWLRTLKPAQLVTLNQYLGQQMEAEQQVRELYSDIKGLDEFAAPLVQKKLHDGHRLVVDASKAQIRFKVTLPPALAALSGKPVERFFQHSLLQAALHNFSADEAQSMPGAQILDAGGQPEPLTPEAFAGICRALDIGKQYQDYLKQHLMAPGATGAEARRRIEEGFRSTLAATVQLAYLKGELQEQIFQSFMTMVAADQAQSGSQRELPVLVAKSWRVLGKQIRGAMAFEVRRDEHPDAPLQGVVCWIPGDEQGALSWYESWDVLFATLGKQLRLPGYDRFFQRFIGERDRIAFTQALAKAAARRAPHLPVELDGRYESINLTVFAHMRQVQIDTLLDNALLLAPPTADRDTQERDQRLHFYRDAALATLGLASLFVPWLGLPLLAVMAYEVVDGIYEGYADWQLGDRQAALEHVLGAAENAVLVGVGVGVGIAAQRVLKSAKVVSRLVPVPINDSQFRLIHPDLPGYEVLDDSLAAGEPSGEPGHERLRTPAATFEVAKDPLTQQWSVRHPVRPDAYAPMLEHNGAGGWRHEFETPQDWQGRSVLFRRLGSALGDVPEQTIDDVLLATGFDEARLRRLHLENAAAPARLLDALQRYQLHQQAPLLQGQAFELRLSQQQAAPTAAAQVLRNVFPGLTPRGAEEIVGRAPRRLVQSMVEDKKVPLQLAGEARWLLRDSRIDRASAGLRQTAAINADTERLALGLLADIAPWPDTLRVEVRDDRGGVIAKAGADSAGEVRVIQRDGASYRAYDAAGRLLTNDTLGDPLFKALLSQVNDQQRRALGEAAASPAAMAERLSQDAFEQRDRAASLIGLQPLPRGLKPLVRSGDGRLGYPLSGGAGKSLGEEDVAADLEDDEAFPDALEQGLRRLFPARDEATVQMYLRGLSGGANDPWPAYRELVNQVRTLRRSLAVWRGQDAERTRIAQEIFDRWQPVLNGETPAFELDLDGQVPGGLAPLPASVQWGRLTRLTLRSIDLAQFDASLVERLDGLRHLSLVDSAITAVPDWLLNLEQLEGLNLSNNQLAALPAGIARLGHLTELNLAHNRFTQVPVEVGELGQLRVLNLQNNHVVVDGSGRAHLARLHRLEVLALSHNPLGDLGSLPSNIALERISLRFARLTEFPSQLVRQHARLNLSLEGNSISELSPESVRVIQLNRNRINLGYNPLSTRAVSLLQEAASDEHPDLLNGGRVVLREAPGPSPAAAETPWLSGYEGETLARRREQWQRLQADEGSATLRALLNELAQDPLYNRHPAFIRARVWALLDACELNPGVRQEIFTVAGDAFGDQPLLMLSDLEVRSQIIQSTAGLAGDQVQAALLRMGRSLYRLNEVDQIASNEVGQRQRAGRYVDSVELLLAYRQGLASSLDLPVNVEQMQLPMLADISPEELDLARDEVLDGESDAAVGVSLASRDFWREYLRARHEQQFSDLDNEFAQRLEDLEEQGLDLNQYFALSGALAAERNVRLEQLYLDLTHEAYRNESAPE